MKKYLLVLLSVVFIIPSIAFASWYNPFSWSIWSMFKTHTSATVPVSKVVPTPATVDNQATNIPVSEKNSQNNNSINQTTNTVKPNISNPIVAIPNNQNNQQQTQVPQPTPIPAPTPIPTPAPVVTQSCSNSLSDSGFQTPSLILSTTTPAQYIVDGGSSAPQSQVTYRFSSSIGNSTINELMFKISGNSPSSVGSISQICVNSTCASGEGGVAELKLDSLGIPAGNGTNLNVQVSYSGVGTIQQGGFNMDTGRSSGITSTLSLIHVGYLSYEGQGGELKCSIPAPTMTLVGSIPTITVPSNNTSGLILGAQSQIGQVLVADNNQNDIKVKTITFNIGSSGFSSTPTITNPFISIDASTPVSGSSCVTSGKIITCSLGTSYSTDFDITAGQTQTFDLFAQVDGPVIFGSNSSISSWLSPWGFVWDDASANGDSATGLTGSQIHGFPTNSWLVHQ